MHRSALRDLAGAVGSARLANAARTKTSHGNRATFGRAALAAAIAIPAVRIVCLFFLVLTDHPPADCRRLPAPL